jgi:hypothetical protein
MPLWGLLFMTTALQKLEKKRKRIMKKEYEVIRYLFDEAEKQQKEIDALIKSGAPKWTANYGKMQLIKDNMKKIRQLALKISKDCKD